MSISSETESLVRAVTESTRAAFPTEVPLTDKDASPAFALAGLARMTDVLDAELKLYLGDSWSVARILGRALREIWLFTMYICLSSEEAMNQLERTDARHREGMNRGVQSVNEILRELGADELPSWAVVGEEEPTLRFNVAKLAKRVDQLLTERGRKAGSALTNFELFYRLESGDDVHPSTFDFFFRYMEPTDKALRILATPPPDGFRTARPDQEVSSDALAVADAVRYVSEFASLPNLFDALSAALEERAGIKLAPL